MSNQGASAPWQRRLVLGTMLVLLLTVGIILLTGVNAANSVGLRLGRVIILGPKYVGTVRLDGGRVEVTSTRVDYGPAPSSDNGTKLRLVWLRFRTGATV